MTGGERRTCPSDGTELTTRRRSGIEVDECPRCRGVWLDRGELEGLIDQEGAGTPRSSVSFLSAGTGVTASRQWP
jgi:Zn-finger nucleic acid-binding protein